jgi:glycosyltransferase involved in cell wall biosynthesis
LAENNFFKKSMRVLQVNKFYYLARGAERYYFDLKKLLEDNGNEVIPFAMANIRNQATPYQDYFAKNVDLKRPNYSLDSLRKAKNIIYNRAAQQDVARLIIKTHPQLVHIHNIYHQLSPAILPVFKHFKLPVVMTIHDFKLICPNYSLFIGGKTCERCKVHRYYNCVLHRCLKNSFGASTVAAAEMYVHSALKTYQKNVDIFIAPSQFVKTKLVEWGWPTEKIKVIPHFTLPQPKLVLPRAKNYIFCFGALERGKGIEELIRALYSEKIDIDLHVAGEGSDRKNLEKLVDKYNLGYRVQFLGKLGEEQLKEEIRHCKFVVVPSIQYEAFGLTVLEAFSYGKPALVSTQGALPELIIGQVGRIFNPQKKGSLGANLRAMLDDPNLEQIGKNAQELARIKYGPQEHYQRIMDVYNQLLGGEKYETPPR